MTVQEDTSGERYLVGSTAEVSEPGSRLISEVNGREVAVFNVGGELHAIANFCNHQAGPLCEGELKGRTSVAEDGWDLVYCDEGKIIQCPWHTWKFDVTTGKNVDDDRLGVPTYETEVDGDDVFVRM